MLLAGDALGRSHALKQLFRFLLACAREGRSPKEIEIAEEVFGRSAGTTDHDATIRVHVHRLRRKLDEFYAGPGAGEPVRLVIPKGGYRLGVEPMAALPAPDDAVAPPVPRRRSRRLVEVAGLLLLLVVVALTSWQLGRRPDATDAPLHAVRSSLLWGQTTANGRRIAIVAGDYYIFGERDAAGDVARLVRDFDVNSPRDLELLVESDPARAGNYVDLGLDYLPVGIGNALRVVAPVLRRNAQGALSSFVVPASQLTPEMVKLTNIVYLGYLSGLGSLRDPVFAGSRFGVGASYDEIIDRRTGRDYMAGTHLQENRDSPSEDYALISAFPGVTGNRIVVIAGTRDAALMQAAEFATRPDALARIAAHLHGATAFEALLAVESLHNVGLRARLLTVSARADPDWSGKRTQSFPDEFHGPLP